MIFSRNFIYGGKSVKTLKIELIALFYNVLLLHVLCYTVGTVVIWDLEYVVRENKKSCMPGEEMLLNSNYQKVNKGFESKY